MSKSILEIRTEFVRKYNGEDYVILPGDIKTIELSGVSFIANEPTIFGSLNYDYISREIAWYNSESLFVHDIPGETPKIWKKVSSHIGKINSNYGYLIYSEDNYSQYSNVLETLVNDPSSRRALMIYTRPSMHYDYNVNGMCDFICTNAVQYLIRKNKLDVIVQMRSNDAWAGYRNDYAWQCHVRDLLIYAINERTNYELEPGNIIWQVGSLHLYENQFYLIDHYKNTGEINISYEDYKKLNS